MSPEDLIVLVIVIVASSGGVLAVYQLYFNWRHIERLREFGALEHQEVFGRRATFFSMQPDVLLFRKYLEESNTAPLYSWLMRFLPKFYGACFLIVLCTLIYSAAT